MEKSKFKWNCVLLRVCQRGRVNISRMAGVGEEKNICTHTHTHTHPQRDSKHHTHVRGERGDYLYYTEIHCKELVHVNMEDGKSKFCTAGKRPRKGLTLQPRTRYNLETSSSLSHTSFSFHLRLSVDQLNPTHTRKGNLFDSDVYFRWCCSVAQSPPILQHHGLQNTRLPCPSLSPEICSNSCPLSRWCHPTISSVTPFSSCPQSFPASGSFSLSWLFASGGQNIGASASASVFAMTIQGWFSLGLSGLILLSKGLSGVLSNLKASILCCWALWSNSHIRPWLLENHSFD